MHGIHSTIIRKSTESSRCCETIDLRRQEKILTDLSEALTTQTASIIEHNQKDLARMEDTNPKKDRLLLNEDRIKALADSLQDILKLKDPTGNILADNTMPNGLHIQKITVPIGVVGVIYEARPNVTIDVAALCLYAGNAVVLRGAAMRNLPMKF